MNSDPDNITELVAAIEAEMATPHKTAALRALRKKYSRLLHDHYGSVVIRIGLSLLRRRLPSARIMAYELIQHHPRAQQQIGSKELFRLGAGIDSWEAVDLFATYLVGPAWRDGRIGDDFVEYWAKSPSRWWRRGALVSTLALNSKEQAGTDDAARTLMVCRLLLDEREEMIVKAMSWALRELGKHDPEAVRGFVRENRERLAARVLREVGGRKKHPKPDR